MERGNGGKSGSVDEWNNGSRVVEEKGNDGTVVPVEWSSEHAPVRLYVYIRGLPPWRRRGTTE